MKYVAKVASSMIFVSELDRSVNFYRDVFGCEVTLQESGAALLLTSGGFQIYIIAKGSRTERPTGGIGAHHLMWTTDTRQALDHFMQLLKDGGFFVDTHTSGEVTFVEGHDPDGIRIIIAHPSPDQRPRSVLDGRFYS